MYNDTHILYYCTIIRKKGLVRFTPVDWLYLVATYWRWNSQITRFSVWDVTDLSPHFIFKWKMTQYQCLKTSMKFFLCARKILEKLQGVMLICSREKNEKVAELLEHRKRGTWFGGVSPLLYIHFIKTAFTALCDTYASSTDCNK